MLTIRDKGSKKLMVNHLKLFGNLHNNLHHNNEFFNTHAHLVIIRIDSKRPFGHNILQGVFDYIFDLS